MQITETSLPGVLLIEPRAFGDARGFFLETWSQAQYRGAGFPEFVQDNHSRSSKGVLRGLHYQLEQTQGKLVSVSRGRVYDVAVDVRHGSPYFGQSVGFELDDEKHHQLYVPPGFAHGFCVMSDTADFVYKCTDYYHPQSEQGIAWNDPDLVLNWPISDPKLSEKDKLSPRLKDQAVDKLPGFEE